MRKQIVVWILLTGLLAACGGDSGADNTETGAASTQSSSTSSSKASLETSVDVAASATQSEATPTATLPAPTPTPSPTVEPTPEPITVDPADRFLIPALGVDAQLTLGVVGADGIAPEPATEDDVVLFDTSRFPGTGGRPGEGNTIYYGKLDSAGPCDGGTTPGPCEGVFYNLRDIATGEAVSIVHRGASFDYTVVALCHVSRADYPQSVFDGGEPERITILSDAYLGEPPTYTAYQTIIIAEREPGTVTGCPAGTLQGAWPTG